MEPALRHRPRPQGQVIIDAKKNLPQLRIVEDDSPDAETDRIQERRDIREAVVALEYAINIRLQQIETEQEYATLWWKLLDRVFRNAGDRQKELRSLMSQLDSIRQDSMASNAHPELLARIHALQAHAMERHAVPEILRAPPAEYEGEPVIRTNVNGAMKPSHEKKRIEENKLGLFGQDGYRCNEVSGTTVVFDGVAELDDSYRVGEVITEKIEEILNGLPDTTEVFLIESYIKERYVELNSVLEDLPEEIVGSATMVATRYLPHAKRLVVLKVGDAEIVIQEPGGGLVRELLPGEPVEKGQERDIGIHRIRVKTEGIIRKPFLPSPEIIVVPATPGTVVYTSSDGIYNNTRKRLATLVSDHTFNAVVSDLPKVIRDANPRYQDDIVVVQQTLGQ